MGNKRDYPKVAQRCLDARKAKGFTLEDVYNETGQKVSTSTLSDLEDNTKTRQVGHEVIIRLAKCYGVSSDYLLGLAELPSPEYDYQNAFKFTGLKQEAIENLNKLMNIEEQQIEALGIDKKEYYKGKIAPVVYDILSAIIANKHFVDLVTYIGQASIYPEEHSKAIPHITDDGNYYYGGIFGREFLEYKALREFKSLMDEVISENKYKRAE